MNSKTRLPLAIVILALAGSPALAQSSVGGPTKPINHVGGATTHPNPVVPPARGATTGAAPSYRTSTKGVSPNPTLTKKK